MNASRQTIVIGGYAVDFSREALIDSDGSIVPLRPRAWLTLKFLALHAGRLVTKSELMEEVWADCEVTDDSLVQAIGDVRRALGEAGRTALRTLPRRGYMLVTDGSGPGTNHQAGLASIGDRLSARASRRFAGRESELALLREAVSASQPVTPLFFVHGPGGIGKTTLLERLRADAALNATLFVRIDAMGVSPDPHAVLAALSTSLRLHEPATTVEDLATAFPKHRSVLIVDSFEHLEPASGWVRDALLPALPSQVSVILAGRQAPDTRWTAHPLWCDAIRSIGLDSLSREEANRLLDAHGVATDSHAGVLDLCHGHPLALVLVADEVRRLGQVPSELGPDLVRALTKRCVTQAPSALHQAALEACARARTTTVALLSEVVDAASAVTLFEWLAEQSYVSSGPEGLSPHELVRDAIDDELRWRDPEGSRALQHAVNRHLMRQVQKGLRVAYAELQYLERRSPLMQRFFNFAALGTISVKPATAADASNIARLRDAGLPPGERALFDRWRHHTATRTLTAHRGSGELCGVTQIIRLDGLDDLSAAADPVVSAVRQALGHALADGSTSLIGRFTVPEGERRGLNPAMHALQNSHAMLWATEPKLRFYVTVSIYPDHFAPLLEGTRFQRLAGCDRIVDGISIGCFVHDWQAEPWAEWRDRQLEV
jgi:DNA-binding winged helix-turn-helix (wHTH) protein